MKMNEYFKKIEEEVKRSYERAGEARKKGLDPVAEVEVPIANSLAERVVGLISILYPQILDKKIVNRILDLEKEYGSLDPAIALTIAEEIAKEKYCKFTSHIEAMEAGIRVALGYLTLGYVSSPIEGFIQLKIKKTREGKDFLAAYFSGPIRSAGGTEAAFSLVIVDYLREVFGYVKYDPTEDEIKRGIHECYEYHERITNLQYLPSEKEIEFLMRNIPIQLTGDPSEDREVYNYKDLERIETNFIRSGFTLVMGEGVAQKASKIIGRVKRLRQKGFKLSDWDFMEDFINLQKKIKEGKEAGGLRTGVTYIQDLVAGRPVFAHPSRSGAFRLRYGRSRNIGYSAFALHPGTMGITKGFIALGTQLKIEKPTKGCTIASCDSIDGPIVKLQNGSVKKIKDYEEAVRLYPEVKEIIYLGDLLVPYGDFLNRNHNLEKPGYVEQYWLAELKKAGGESDLKAGFEKALELSSKFKVALHPDYIYYWSQINYEEFLSLIDWIVHGEIVERKMVLPFSKIDKERFANGKRTLEILGCEHNVHIESAILNEENSKGLLFNLGIEINNELYAKGVVRIDDKIDEIIKKIQGRKSLGNDVLEIINELCKFKIKDKAGTFIGARMGRPEKAKLRKLTGSPHALFPVGDEGGRLRSVQAAIFAGEVNAEFPLFFCQECKKETIYPRCETCNSICIKRYYCPECDRVWNEKCQEHGRGLEFKEKSIDIAYYFENARKKIGLRNEELKDVIKGVRGTSNKEHSCEHLAKGVLRAKYNLHVNKDGTIRYDMTEMPLTHFKPKEIGTSIEKLKELGYEEDIYGDKLENDNQVLEIFPHDVILPSCPDSPDERADDVLLNITKFVDDELEKLYGVRRYFNASKKEELIGVLLGCIAPHTASTSVGRLIGFSKVQALLASPYMHAAMRRDCLGYNNFISVNENGLWKIEKIGAFIEKHNPEEKADIYGTLKKDVKGIKTWSNPGAKEVAEITKHQPIELLRIHLEDGRKIEATENHKFYLQGKKEIRAHELKEGSKLMVSYKRDIEEKDIDNISLAEIFSDRDDVMIRNVKDYLSTFEKLNSHQNFVFRDSFPIGYVKEILNRNGKNFRDLPSQARIAIKRDNVVMPIIVPLNENLLEVIGLYISEGHLRKNDSKKGFYQLGLAGNKEVRNFVKEVMGESFQIKPSWENEEGLTFSSRLLYELFKNYLGTGDNAHNKRIPSIFLNLKKEKIAALLRGYYEGDGSVSLSDIRVTCDSVSEGLKYDLSFVLSRFGIFTKFYEYEKEPGPQVKDFYIRKGKGIPKFKITKIIVPSNFVKKFKEIGFLSERKNKILNAICKQNPRGMRIEHDDKYVYPKVKKIEKIEAQVNYCFNVAEEHNFFANDILVHNCDGDEAAIMLLMDLLLNFSRKFIPGHRGGTQDAPLVLNVRIKANEVDDMIFDVDISKEIPLELYEAAERHKHPNEIKMEQVRNRLGTNREFTELYYSYPTDDINLGQRCSSYKTLPTMEEKVKEMMNLCGKIRAVDVRDVARLIIERHFIRDTRGNLRKFSQQGFRCVQCNDKYRRPPLVGKCTKCGGKIIFTISEGSILKYMQPALDLAVKYKVSPYLLESLELTQMYIESIFGKEKEKQESIGKWF